MPDVNDKDLVREFTGSKSEAAFAALVRQHVNLVFATALRQVGDRAVAEEITQSVFVALAQSAGRLGSHPTIAGWLHQTALNKSREWLRSELRRRKREQTAVELAEVHAEGDSVWVPLVPLLDEALLQLRDADRAAVIMHFMEGRTFQEVGSALGVGEDTARKRVSRCLEQLAKFFQRRGFTTPALSVGAPLFALASHTAPANLVASAASAGSAAYSISTSTLTLKGALKIMAWTKAKTAVVAGAAVLLTAGTTTLVVKVIQEHRTYPWQVVNGNSDAGINALNDTPPQVMIVPSKYKTDTGHGSLLDDIPPQAQWRYIGIHSTPAEIIERAEFNGRSLLPSQIILPPDMPNGHYDYIANLKSGSQPALQALIRKKFGLIGKYETRNADVMLLVLDHPGAPGLKPFTPSLAEEKQPMTVVSDGMLHYQNKSMSDLVSILKWRIRIPVLDQTGLTGNYDMDIPALPNGIATESAEGAGRWLMNGFGLKLVPTNMPIEMLVVEKAK